MSADKEFETLPPNQQVDIVERIKNIRATLDFLDNVLKNKNKSLGPVKKPVVTFIVPNIKTEFDIIKSKKMRFIDFVVIFERFISNLSFAVINNQESWVYNKKLQEHLLESLEICRTIDFAAKQFLGEGYTR